MRSQGWVTLNFMIMKIVNISTYFKTCIQANLWHVITNHWIDLLSQEWSHLKDMLSVLLTMSNFSHFIQGALNQFNTKLFKTLPHDTNYFLQEHCFWPKAGLPHVSGSCPRCGTSFLNTSSTLISEFKASFSRTLSKNKDLCGKC